MVPRQGVGSPNLEVAELGFHLVELQEILLANPVVDEVCDLLEPARVTAAVIWLVSAVDEEIAVYELVDEGGYEQASVVLLVLENSP